MKQKFNVTGMTCSACSAHVEKAVRQVEGVDSVSVNLLGNSMLVEYGGKTGWQIERCYILSDELERAKALMRTEKEHER